MKTLKRTLCLVLVLVMVAGLLSVGANAAYPDQDEIYYDVAVGYMSAKNILAGRDSGEFDPAGDITRAEIAKILYCTMTGKKYETAAPYASAGTFSDVAANAWYAGVVNYIADEGIVVGYEGKFRPDDSITGYEVLMVVVRALGYDAAKEITEAPSWTAAVYKQADKLNVVAGVKEGTDFSKACTRELACQLMFNAFQNGPATYSKDTATYTPVPANALFKPEKVAAQQVDAVALNTTSTDANYGKVEAKVGSTYKWVADYDALGHVYDLYVEGGKVVYADKISSVVTITKADMKSGEEKYEVATGYKQVQNCAADTGSADFTDDYADTVITIPGATATAKPIIKAVLLADVLTIEKVAVTVSTATATKGDVEAKIDTTTIFYYDASAKKATTDLVNVDFSGYTKAATEYYVVKEYDGLYDLTATSTITGKVSSYVAGKSYVIDGKTYEVSALTDNSGLVDKAISVTDGNVFYLADGKIFAIANVAGNTDTDKVSAYVYGAYVKELVAGVEAGKDVYGQASTEGTKAVYGVYALGVNEKGEKIELLLSKHTSSAATKADFADAKAAADTAAGLVAPHAAVYTVAAATGIATKGDALVSTTLNALKVSKTIDGDTYYYDNAKAYYISDGDAESAWTYSKVTVSETSVQNSTTAYLVAAPVAEGSTNYTVTAIFYVALDAPEYSKDLIFVPAGSAITAGSYLNAAGTAMVDTLSVDAYVNGVKTTITIKADATVKFVDALTNGTETATPDSKVDANIFYEYVLADGIYTLQVATGANAIELDTVKNVYGDYITLTTTSTCVDASVAGVNVVNLTNNADAKLVKDATVACVWDATNGFTVIYLLSVPA